MKAITNKLIYRLECAGYGSTDVVPLGESSFSIDFELVNDDTSARYGYDVKFSGSLIFTGSAFQFLYDAETGGFRCADMYLILKSNGCGGEYEEFLEGTKIKLSQGKWDLDKCRVEIPVINTDPYECINEKKGDTINMFATSGTPEEVQLYGYVPTFEFSYMPANGGTGFGLTTQNFEHYPNRRSEYPGFGCEGELVEPYFPESATTLFETDDLKNLTRNGTTFHEILSTGSIPQHVDYPTYAGAFDAVADGWRLYFFKYRCTFSDISGVMNYSARWRWVRETKDVVAGSGSPGADWVYISTSGGFDKYARPPIMMPRDRIYKPSYKTVQFPDVNTVHFEYTNYIVGLDENIVNIYDNNDEPNAGTSNGNIYGFKTIPNGLSLNALIEYGIDYCCPGLVVKSEFLQINPDTPTTTNYVTGTTSFVDQLYLFQKSDVKRPWATEQATVGNFTMDEILLALWNMMQLKYCIIGGVFRIEHISSDIFRVPATRDLTAPPLNRMTAGKRQYTYNTENLFAKETFAFMEQRSQTTFLPSDDFAGMPILYDGNCVNREEKKNVLDRKVSRITTDILFVLINGGGSETKVQDNTTSNKYTVQDDRKNSVVSDDGFCLVAGRDISGTIYGIAAPPILDSVERINNVLGWAHLHDNFYRTDRNAESGTMNGNPITFDSTKHILQQVPLPFDLCCIATFDPYEQITGDFGDAVMKSGRWEVARAIMTADLIYRL